jgi:hypothetical protein
VVQRRSLPGLAFSLPTDAGFVIGLATHDIPRLGTLIWISRETYDEEPGTSEASGVNDWRWPIFFPLNAALRGRIATKIGHVPIPDHLAQMPVMRSRAGSGRAAGWNLVELPESGSPGTRVAGSANDPKVPIYQIVNDTRLKEMVASGWRPEHEW